MNTPLILSLLSVMFLMYACGKKVDDTIQKEHFGITNEGESVDIYTLTNIRGARVRITNYGAIVQSLTVPDRHNNFEDVVLGYETLDGYIQDDAFFGAIVGRYGNRIAGGRFTLNGTEYQLTLNEGNNHLHGGNGFFKRVWSAEEVESELGPALKLTYHSPHLEEGYPGNLTIEVLYTLTDQNELRIDYTAVTDQKTIINPTHHSYFNLSGDLTRPITDHELMIDAGAYTPVNNELIPTGELRGVVNTPMDFLQPTKIGARIDDDYEQLRIGGGYDHNWVLNNFDRSVRKVGSLYEPESGRLMEIYTTEPGLQFYSGNFLDGTKTGKESVVYNHRTGLCLEAQHFPNAPNIEHFHPVTLNPGETYRQTTIYKFSVR
jgi:aldose 1-epimerase